MSEENVNIEKTITNFTKDIQGLLELLNSITSYEQRIQAHIKKLTSFVDFQSVTDIAVRVESELKRLSKEGNSLKEDIKHIKDVTDSKLKKNVVMPLVQSLSVNEIDPKTKVTSQQKPAEQCNSNNAETTTNGNEDTLATEHTTLQNNENSIAESNVVKTELGKPKPGLIRLVPLQNLLSTPVKRLPFRLQNSPLVELTISDSDEDGTSIENENHKNVLKKKQQILDSSDSYGMEQHLNSKKENGTCEKTKTLGKEANLSDKPRIKITPLRKTAESKQIEKKQCNSDSSCEIESLEANNLSPVEIEDVQAKVSTDTTSKIQAKHSNNADKHLGICGAFENTSRLSQEQKSLKNCTKSKNFSTRNCVVRIKRTPLITNNSINLNNYNQRSKIENKNKKTMADYSNSDVEDISKNESSENNSSSESEIVPTRKKRIFLEKKKGSSASSDSEVNEPISTTRKKRKIVKTNSSSESGSNSNASDDKIKKRKKIRKLIKEKNLEDGTKRATKEEEDRKKRIEERQKMYNQIYVKPANVEVDELILDFDEASKKPLLKVDSGLMKKLKPHQVNGVKFMWDACFETIKDCQEKPGSGCILAHCMGLGKTLQIVTLAHTLLTNYDVTHCERVLIISPLSTLNNWAREFNDWIRFAKKKDIEIYDMSKYKDKNTRVFKLEEWFIEGGICIVGYDMYRILSNEKTKGLRKKQKDSLKKSLVDPGPDVVVCDEGHLLKNEKTSLSQAVTKIRTKRRIVLTGTPLQNNLKEYYCMIQFIKPHLLGTYKEYLNRFVNPITNGQYTDSTERDIRLMKHRSHILHKMLEACIQRRDYSVLAPYLPPKHEYVVFVTLSETQKQLYGHYMTTQRELIGESSGNPGKGAKLFQDFQNLRRIWTHPMNLRVNSDTVIRKKLAQYDSDESMKDFIADSDETSSTDSDASSLVETDACGAKPMKHSLRGAASDNDNDCIEMEMQTKDDPSEWWTKFVDNTELNNIFHSPKLVILMNLLQRCEEIGDKVLVFSQSLQSLDVIEHFLSLIDRKTRGEEIEGNVGSFTGNWRPGVNYFRLDGSRTVENREMMCKSFNNVGNLDARLFLISTRAGGLGINLVAANRVVIFDVSWNPSHDTQSIFRVYRFGQTKPCYIYRLIALGTMEQKVYERQVAKQATAKRVIDEQQISRHYNQSDLQELYSYELEPSTSREIPILPKDRLFAELLSNHEKLLFKYHEHDSLLENEDSENLTEEERKAAWDEYEAEKTRPPQPTMQYMSYDRQSFLANYGNPSGSVTSNKIFGFRSDILLRLLNMKGCRDHPELTSGQVIHLVPEYLQRLYMEMNSGDPTLYKELLELHKSLEAPGGMYMNPLLFANQTPAPPPVGHSFGAPVGPYGQVHPSTSNFNSNEVYEVD